MAAIACAEAHDDVMDVLASMAGALPEGNVPRFMAAISKSMPARETLEKNVTSLVNGTEVSASILPISESGDDQTYKIDLDWVLDVRSLEQDGPLTRRREVIHCELRKEKAHWKIVALQPLDFFAPK
jgi:hypothetical protein